MSWRNVQDSRNAKRGNDTGTVDQMDSIGRRRLLGSLAASAIAGTIMAACGTSEPSKTRSVPTLKASKPKPGSALPEPGERRPMPVVAIRAGGDLWLPSVFSAFGKAEVASEGRYTYPEVAIKDSLETRSSLWSYGGELALRSDSAPAIVNFGQGDFIDLVETESLLPLDQHFKDDSNFDPDAYWPGTLEAGQVRGVQYALPYGVAIWVVAFSDHLAAAVQVNPPSSEAFDNQEFLQKAIALQGARSLPGFEDTQGTAVIVSENPVLAGEVNTSTPGYAFLHSAIGPFGGDTDSYDGLRLPAALEAAELYHDLAIKRSLRISVEESWNRLQEAKLGMFVYLLSGRSMFFKTATKEEANYSLYPFPAFGAPVNPAEAWGMLGIAATTDNPDAAYDAMHVLDRQIQTEAFIPALRQSPSQLFERLQLLTERESEMVVELLENASFITLTRRERGVLNRVFDGGIALHSNSPDEALRQAALELGG